MNEVTKQIRINTREIYMKGEIQISKAINKVLDQWNEIADSEWYRSYRTDEAIQKVIREPEVRFYRQTWSAIKTAFPDIKGKKICVPSSGNNHFVFAFAAMGAKVTSCDICEKQLNYAEEIAKDRNLDIEFLV